MIPARIGRHGAIEQVDQALFVRLRPLPVQCWIADDDDLRFGRPLVLIRQCTRQGKRTLRTQQHRSGGCFLQKITTVLHRLLLLLVGYSLASTPCASANSACGPSGVAWYATMRTT